MGCSLWRCRCDRCRSSRTVHWTTGLLRTLLLSLVTVCVFNLIANLVARFVYRLDDHSPWDVFHLVLFSTTIVAGAVINLGTVIQIVCAVRNSSLNVDFKYTECLMSGCLALLIAQIHAEVFNLLDNGVRELLFVDWCVRLATPVTTLMSFLSVTVFHLVTRRLAGRLDDGHRSIGSSSGRRLRPRKSKLVFVEGTACIGKTTVSDVSFDYGQYLKNTSLFSRKTEEASIQAVYEVNLHADLLAFLDRIAPHYETRRTDTSTALSEETDYIIDRSPLSQLAYALLFRLDGQREEPHRFVERFDRYVLHDHLFTTAIRSAANKWYAAVERLVGNRARVHLLWYGSLSPSLTVSRLRERGGFENKSTMSSNVQWNLLHYTYNQNYTFRRLAEITAIGPYLEVDLLDRHTVLCDADNN